VGSVTERLLTARELADVLGLSSATVLDRFEAGDLPGFRLFGRKGGPVRFRESEILSALETWRFGAAAKPHDHSLTAVRTELHTRSHA
jgi:excisionase family DNA binding protein